MKRAGTATEVSKKLSLEVVGVSSLDLVGWPEGGQIGGGGALDTARQREVRDMPATDGEGDG